MRIWAGLSLDAKIVGALAVGNWLLLFGNHTILQVTRDAPMWQLFPGLWGAAWLLACGLLAAAYPLRDHAAGRRFAARDRALHLGALILLFVVVPTVAAIVLRETGKPYTYVHDGAIMVEEAARKLVAGQNPYVADYLDTPLFYWPMINNPALYHFTYFPALFLVTVPFVVLFDRLALLFDQRYLYLPAYVATLVIVPLLLRSTAAGEVEGGLRSRARSGGTRPARREEEQGGRGADRSSRCGPPEATSPAAVLSLVAIVGLHPQLFPFVAEGRNDFFVLLFLFAGIALLQRERRTLAVLLIAVAAASKLHAGPLLPLVLAYLFWKDGALPLRVRWLRLLRASWAGAIVLTATFLPFVVDDVAAFWDDVVAYNAGASAWSYPVSGMGFSALLRTLRVISHPQQDFPFAVFQLAAALPLTAWSLQRLRRDPQVATLLTGYAVTLLAFLFFGRYFHGNHLGFIVAVASPIPFLRPQLLPDLVARLAGRARAAVPRAAPTMVAPVAITRDTQEPAA